MMPHIPLRFCTTLITSRAIHTDMSLRSGSAPCSSCSSPSAQVRQCLLSFHYPPRRGPGPCLFNGGLTSSHAAFHVVQAIHTRLWWLFLTVVFVWRGVAVGLPIGSAIHIAVLVRSVSVPIGLCLVLWSLSLRSDIICLHWSENSKVQSNSIQIPPNDLLDRRQLIVR